MEPRHPGMLLDSNIIIYAIQPAHSSLRAFLKSITPFTSAVSFVEVLGYPALTADDERDLRALLTLTTVLPVSMDVIDRAVSLRRQRRMSLGDALLGGTALVHGLTLVTRNATDFRWIPGLQVLDPFQAPPAPAP